MPHIKRRKTVNYSQEQMYALVNDVASYAQFIPHCTSSEIVSETSEEIRATLTFSRGGLSKSFTTLNRLRPHKMVEIRLLDGPFKQLEGFWQFEAVPNGCCVSLDMSFEFSSRWLGLMFGPLFNQVASMLVDAFCERAQSIYSKK